MTESTAKTCRATVLVVEDESTLAHNVSSYLKRKNFEVSVAPTGEEGIRMLDSLDPDIVLLDHCLPGLSGLDVLRQIRKSGAQTKVVMMTGHGGVGLAVDAMKAGASDYLSKPIVLSELELLVEKLVDFQRLESEVEYHRHRVAVEGSVDALLGNSEAIRSVRNRIRQFLESERKLRRQDPPTVLVTGETGTGKEIVARAFHFDGPRFSEPFIELNCAAIPGELIEAELFGYERGAFTDAKSRKYGLVESAEGGTLFLDEIGDMNAALQSKLLTLLEQKRVRRVGGLQDRAVDVRIIAATNQDLDARTRNGEFRKDLLYRLRVIHIDLPPLRERHGDILFLARHFLSLHGRRYGRRNLGFDESAQAALLGYDWPGNVRELRNVVEQAVLLSAGRLIAADHILIPRVETDAAESSNALGLGFEEAEAALLHRALKEAGGNVSRAARLLGIGRDKFRYRMNKLGVDRKPD